MVATMTRWTAGEIIATIRDGRHGTGQIARALGVARAAMYERLREIERRGDIYSVVVFLPPDKPRGWHRAQARGLRPRKRRNWFIEEKNDDETKRI